MKQADQHLGDGSEKLCYTVKDHPGFVCLFGNDKDRLLEEARELRRLRRLGLPTLDVTFETILDHTGAAVPALIAPRYDFHCLCGSVEPKDYKHLVLNEAHRTNLKAIQKRLLFKRAGVADLQFLFKNNGEVVLNDPTEVNFRDEDSAKLNSKAIRAMLRYAQR